MLKSLCKMIIILKITYDIDNSIHLIHQIIIIIY
jgi:hypothetical protein